MPVSNSTPIPLSTLTRLLVDTNVAIDLICRSTTAGARLHPDAVLFVPVIVLGELYHGAFNAQKPDRALAEVEDFAVKVKVLGCDLGVSRWFGQLRRELWRKGRKIPDNDVWIAAVAVTHGLPVLTNDHHFKEVDALTVVDW